MNKGLLLVSIFTLISLTTFLIFQKKSAKDLLNISPITFEQFVLCFSKVPQITEIQCATSEGFMLTSNEFTDYITPLNSKPPQACIDLDNLQKQSTTQFYINQDNLFFSCYANETARRIANNNECFFKNFYAPIYLICSGLDIYAYPPYTKFDIKN
ncbi:transmembrane protein, putative (macronuclear) [Tetrahymena thermophila SB210]|uniref:Transmembrane protein, putative n=1 Tax=Tetrahymena thermophila (strain SB210) TaxID=312017 RepID=Q23B20_TETTS|nr:transmembrane protein, putative [Tetrahymena thermophila SB210]EAR93664.1 transmembrane protein, putative [Tetrahymena thermophila SB210]|eukprot:XP_001013909.1 transmembrane protein, putative [Tetrahymena thermophila SB210]